MCLGGEDVVVEADVGGARRKGAAVAVDEVARLHACSHARIPLPAYIRHLHPILACHELQVLRTEQCRQVVSPSQLFVPDTVVLANFAVRHHSYNASFPRLLEMPQRQRCLGDNA